MSECIEEEKKGGKKNKKEKKKRTITKFSFHPTFIADTFIKLPWEKFEIRIFFFFAFANFLVIFKFENVFCIHGKCMASDPVTWSNLFFPIV